MVKIKVDCLLTATVVNAVHGVIVVIVFLDLRGGRRMSAGGQGLCPGE